MRRELASLTWIGVVCFALVSCGDDDDSQAVEDGGHNEAGPEPDVKQPPPPECTRDDECDDGRFCNGQERCRAGSCADGEYG